jgi:hypothetical protein
MERDRSDDARTPAGLAPGANWTIQRWASVEADGAVGWAAVALIGRIAAASASTSRPVAVLTVIAASPSTGAV